MINVDVLFRIMEELPLEAVEHVHEYINSQPYKVENRKATPDELRHMATGLQTLIAELQEMYPKEDDTQIDSDTLAKMSRHDDA